MIACRLIGSVNSLSTLSIITMATIENKTVKLFGYYVPFGKKDAKSGAGSVKLVKIIPGLNLNLSDTVVSRLQDNPGFKHQLDLGNLKVYKSIPEPVGEKHGKQIFEDENGAPALAIDHKALESGKKTRYIPNASELKELKGVGAKTAEAIVERAANENWYNFGDMVKSISKDYPTIDFTPKSKDISTK